MADTSKEIVTIELNHFGGSRGACNGGEEDDCGNAGTFLVTSENYGTFGVCAIHLKEFLQELEAKN